MLILLKLDLQRSTNMAGQIRPNKKCAKIAYDILKTPKDLQQRAEPIPSEKMIRVWFRDSSTAQ